jgi:hypothetical protein
MSETLLIVGWMAICLGFYFWGYRRGRKHERDQITLDTYESWQKHNDRRKERPFS